MTKRTLRALAAALTLGAAPAALAQSGTNLNYEDADLRAVAQDIGLRTNRVFVIDPSLAGTVNIISPPGTTLDADTLWEVFQATLQLNGYTAVPIGGREYKIVRTAQALRESGNGAGQGGADLVTQVVPLRFVDVREAVNSVRSLVAETGLLSAITETNTLIIADTADNVARITDLLQEIDRDESVYRPIRLQNALAVEVASTLREIANSGVAEGQRSGVSIVPVAQSNTVVLRGSPQEVARLVPVVRDLDQANTSRTGLNAIYLNHADAEEVVELLRTLLGEQVEGGEGVVPGQMQTAVAADPATNAVVVNAPPDTTRLVRQIVGQLDIRRPQVMIEAIVVQISSNTARDLGVQYLSGGNGIPATAASFPGSGPSLISAAGAAYFLGPGSGEIQGGVETTTLPDGSVIRTPRDGNQALASVSGEIVQAAVRDLLSFNGFLAGFADITDDGSVYGVLLNAIQSDADSNVLSTPFTTVLDNETARLQVGQEVPIVSGRASGDDFNGGVFTNVERQDVGTILEVTPSINDGNTIRLQTNLELSSISAFAGPNQDIILDKSQVENDFLADDGQIVVIGGLVSNQATNTESKVPVLGDIPLLGNLFKGSSRSSSDQMLMIFIRPTIIRDAETARLATIRKYDYARQRELEASGTRRGPSRLDTLQQEVLGLDPSARRAPVVRVPPAEPVPVPASAAPSDVPQDGGPIVGQAAVDVR